MDVCVESVDADQVKQIFSLKEKKLMLEFLKTSDGHMKSKLNMESLNKPELLMLFSILEGELEARDLVIDALKAQRKDLYVQERYGRYDLSDPFLALQRDGEAVGGGGCGGPSGRETSSSSSSSSSSNPLVVLRLVVSHCRRMQDKMLAQLAAAESRHRRVIMDLEEEKRRHAEDTAEGDDVTYILEKERERLHQQLDFERSQVRRLEKEQRRVEQQLEEERAQHKQLSCALAKECKWASARALDEGQRVAELNRKLDKEKEASQAVRRELEEERRRALRMEARVEEQLAEFDTEREQLRSRLKKEEAHCSTLQQQVEELRRKLEEGGGVRREEGEASAGEELTRRVEAGRKEDLTRRVPLAETRTDSVEVEDVEDEEDEEGLLPASVNGHPHRCPATTETDSHHRGNVDTTSVLPENSPPPHAENAPVHTGTSSSSSLLSPGGTTDPSSSSSLTPPSSSSPSPCASPVLDKHPAAAPGGGGYQSSYQAGINQRFHAARHKFQGTTAAAAADPAEAPPQPQPQAGQPAAAAAPAQSSKEASPSPSPSPSPAAAPAPEPSPVKQLARSTVTQVLSRFTTVQQSVVAKLPATATATPPNNSPFGTDYRSLAAPLSPVISRAAPLSPVISRAAPLSPVVGRAAASAAVPPPPGVRSPTIPRADRGNPPPIPPKKPGLAQTQAPASPAPVARSPAGHFSPDGGPLSASCGLVTSSQQEAVKELDMVVSSS